MQCPTTMNQADRFKEYTEESGNDFDAYISIVKKANSGRELTKEAQIKHLLKDVLWGRYAKKVINLLRLGLKYKSYNKIQKEYEAKLVQVRNREIV